MLCAHRRGAYGVSVWTARIEGWLAGELERGRWYPGRPLLVTENDYGLRLYNGDTGVVVATEHGRTTAAFERQGEVVLFPPARLGAVDTVYAMTVHKSQGSQFGTAAVLLPAVDVAGPDARAALHRGDPRPVAPHPRRHRGDDPRGGGAAGRPRLRPRRAPMSLMTDTGPTIRQPTPKVRP